MLCPWNTFLQIPSLHSVTFSLSTLASFKSHHSGTERCPPCVTSPRATRTASLLPPHDSSKVACELVRLCDTQQKCSREAGTALTEGPIKILKFGLWLWFQVLDLGYATDFHKTWADPQMSRTELLLKIQLLTLSDARKSYLSTAQGFSQINSPTLMRNSEGRGLMHLLDSLADIFALLFLSPLKSCSHISEEYCSIIFIYCALKLLLWGYFSNKNTAFLLVLFCLAGLRYIFVTWKGIYKSLKFCCISIMPPSYKILQAIIK